MSQSSINRSHETFKNVAQLYGCHYHRRIIKNLKLVLSEAKDLIIFAALLKFL